MRRDEGVNGIETSLDKSSEHSKHQSITSCVTIERAGDIDAIKSPIYAILNAPNEREVIGA